MVCGGQSGNHLKERLKMMTDEELNKALTKGTKPLVKKPSKKKAKKKNTTKLWEQLNEETLRKLGYIK